MPKLSVIIPTYNPKRYLPQLRHTLARQTIDFELVIIDSSSTDGSVETLRQMADRFMTIPTDAFDHGGTRTLAAKEAQGELLLFLTQDALPVESNTFETIRDFLLQDTTLGAVFGKQLPYPETSLFGAHLRYFNYPNTSYRRCFDDRNRYGIKTAFLSDSFALYQKRALASIDFFKPRLIVGEDTYAGAKLLQKGWCLGYCAQAKVYHAHSYSIAQEFQRYFDIGVFHAYEKWLIDTFGKAEGEGWRYVVSELQFLYRHKRFERIPEFFLRNAAKLLGYRLGKHHEKLPQSLLRVLSMHKKWWTQSYDI